MWKNRVKPDTTDDATETHSEYEILIAFPQQQWLHEHAAILRLQYVRCLSCYSYFAV
jgi:hypothetical protein